MKTTRENLFAANGTNFHEFCLGQKKVEKTFLPLRHRGTEFFFWVSPCFSASGASGLKPFLMAWKSAKADSITSPKGFHELRQGFSPTKQVQNPRGFAARVLPSTSEVS
jgi:hypothetical protein